MNEKKVLKKILDECPDGYGVFDLEDLCSCAPRLTNVQVKSILKHLENAGYISVKYYDEKSYCLSPLPKAKQLFEEKTYKKIWLFVAIFLFAFLGGFLGSVIAVLF